MTCGCTNTTVALTAEQKKILKALAGADKPWGSKEIAAATGIDAKTVSSRLTVLKKDGLIDSPVRCKYATTAAGRSLLG